MKKIFNIILITIYLVLLCLLLVFNRMGYDSREKNNDKIFGDSIKSRIVNHFTWYQENIDIENSGVGVGLTFYQNDYIPTDKELGNILYKYQYNIEQHNKPIEYIVIYVGTDALSVNGVNYTIEPKEAYDAFLMALKIHLIDFGINPWEYEKTSSSY